MSTIKVADLQHISNSNNSISIAQNSSVALKHSGNQKLITTANGVDITGACTATSFTGDGANLTNLPAPSTFNAANLTGALPAIDGSALTGIAAGGGALEFVSKTEVASNAGVTYVDITGLTNDSMYKMIGQMRFGSSNTEMTTQFFLNGSSTVNGNSWYSYLVRNSTSNHWAYNSSASLISWSAQGYYKFDFEMTFSTGDPAYVFIQGISLYPDYFAYSNLYGGLNNANTSGNKISGFRFANQAGDVMNGSKILLYKYKES